MKLIQINAWLGRLNGPLREFIAAEQPDFVCLQEAFQPNDDVMSNVRDQYNFVEEIIQVGGFEHQLFAPAWAFEMAGAIIEAGNMILSKYPLRGKLSFHTSEKYHVRRAPGDDLANARVWLGGVADVAPAKAIGLASYQGYLTGANPLGDAKTTETLEKVAGGLAKLPEPKILGADLNVSPSSPAMRVLDKARLRNLTAEYKIQTTLSEVHRAPPQARNQVACDYILLSPGIKVQKFYVADKIVSDHKALVLEFEL